MKSNEIIEEGIVEIQTPQIFDFKNLMKSYKRSIFRWFQFSRYNRMYFEIYKNNSSSN